MNFLTFEIVSTKKISNTKFTNTKIRVLIISKQLLVYVLVLLKQRTRFDVDENNKNTSALRRTITLCSPQKPTKIGSLHAIAVTAQRAFQVSSTRTNACNITRFGTLVRN
jgi:hypothetical protein